MSRTFGYWIDKQQMEQDKREFEELHGYQIVDPTELYINAPEIFRVIGHPSRGMHSAGHKVNRCTCRKRGDGTHKSMRQEIQCEIRRIMKEEQLNS